MPSVSQTTLSLSERTQGLVNRISVGAVDRASLAVLRLVLLCAQLPSIRRGQ